MTTRLIPGLVLALAMGCSPTPEAAPEVELTPVEQVGQILRTCREMGKPAPKTPKDAEKIPGASPGALEALKSGEVVIYWGVNLDEHGGTTLIGHEKDAPEQGGRVILGDGTVVELDADQIRELPRPPAHLLKPGTSGRKGSR